MAVIFYREIRWRPAYELKDNETGSEFDTLRSMLVAIVPQSR